MNFYASVKKVYSVRIVLHVYMKKILIRWVCVTVEFDKGEDPHVIMTGVWEVTTPAYIAISPNGEVLVISHGSSLSFYNTVTGTLDNTIRYIFSSKYDDTMPMINHFVIIYSPLISFFFFLYFLYNVT